jgi:hypothetical protein
VIPDWAKPYNQAMASTRIRVYDVIKFFSGDKDYVLEIRNPVRKYDAVIFQKTFGNRALELAKKMRSLGTKVLLDINVNYYDATSKYVSDQQFQSIRSFTAYADAIITTNEFLGDYVRKLFPNKRIFVIEESIDDSYFMFSKVRFNHERTLVWAGYADKASELTMISDLLLRLYKQMSFRIILICEKNPMINIDCIPIGYLRYKQAKIAQQLTVGDIFIAPRDLSDSYNLSHSFTKVGTAMAAGLPVIASAVPSYLGSPAVICRTKADWLRNFKNLLADDTYMKQLSRKGLQYVKEHYSVGRVYEKYRGMFEYLLA